MKNGTIGYIWVCEEGHFAPDELALMSTSVMAGDIAGESRLLVAEINSQVQSSFENLHAKFFRALPTN